MSNRNRKQGSTKNILRAAVLATPALLALSMLSRSAQAANVYWDSDANATGNDAGAGGGLGGSGTWDSLITSNWWDGVSGTDQQWNDANNDNAIFWGTAGTVTIATGQTRAASGLDFRTAGYTLTGGTVSLGGGTGIVNVNTGTANISSLLAGATGLTKTGGGTLSLINTANTFTGTIALNAGTLLITGTNANGSLGPNSNSMTIDNGATFQVSGAPTVNRVITIGNAGGTFNIITATSPGFTNPAGTTGALIGSSAAVITVNGLAGSTMFINSGGNASFSNSGYLGTWNVIGGELNPGNITNDLGFGAIPTAVNPSYFTLNGSGTVGLRFGAGAALQIQANRGITLGASGASIDAVAAAAIVTISPVITGAGQLRLSGPGTVILANTNTYSNGSLISAGTVDLTASQALGTGSVTVSGGTLALGAIDQSFSGFHITGGSVTGLGANLTAPAFDVQGGTITANLIGGGALTKSSTGTATLNANVANTYNGGTSVTGGNLIAATTASLPGYNAPGAIPVSATATLAGSAGGAGQFASADLDTLLADPSYAAGAGFGINVDTGNGFTYASNITNTNAGANLLNFSKFGAGLLVLSGNNTYTGSTSISGGILRQANSTAIPVGTAMTLTGGTYDMNSIAQSVGSLAGTSGNVIMSGALTAGSNNTTTSYGGLLSGTGALTKIGTGSLRLGNTGNSYTGGTVVNGGSIVYDADPATSGGGGTSELGTVPTNNSLPGITLNGATLEMAGTAAVGWGNTRRIDLGAAGGTINVSQGGGTLQFGYTAGNMGEGSGSGSQPGIFSASGSRLVKTGPGQLWMNKSGTASTFHGLTITQGIWHVDSSDGIGNSGLDLGAIPPNASTDAIAREYGLVLDYNGNGGGAIYQERSGQSNLIIINNARAVFIGNGGGSLDTRGSSTSYGGVYDGVSNFAGIRALNAPGTGTFFKIGGGDFESGGSVTFGSLVVNAGAYSAVNESEIGLGTASSPAINITLNNTGTGSNVNATNDVATFRMITNQTTTTLGAPHNIIVGDGTAGRQARLDIDSNTVNWSGNITGTGTLTKTISLANAASLPAPNGTGTLNFPGSIASTVNMVVDKGTMNMTGGANSGYAGAWQVNTGATLGFNNAAGLGSAAVTLAGGTLNANGSGSNSNTVNVTAASSIGAASAVTETLSGAITSNSSTLTKVSPGTIYLTGASAYNGPVTVAGAGDLGGTQTIGGLLTVNGSARLAPGTAGPGTLPASGGLTLSSAAVLDYDLANTNTVGGGVNDLLAVTGPLTLGSSLTFNLNAYNGDVANATYKLITYTGALTGNTSGWTIGTNNASGFHVYTFSTATANEVDLTVQGAGSKTWTGSTDASWDTSNNWNAVGKPAFSDNVTFPTPVPGTGPTVTLTAGEVALTLTFNDSYTLSGGSLAVFAGGVYVDSAQTVTMASVLTGSGSIIKNGGGTLALSQSNTYTGATTINAGGLRVDSGGRIPSSLVSVTGGTLQFNGGAANDSATISVTSGGLLQFAGGGAFNSKAAVTLANPGSMDVNGQTPTVGSISGDGPITLGGGGGVLTTGGNNASTTYSGVISGNGNLTKTGTGTMVLPQATNTYSGDTSVNGGVLQIAGDGSLGATGTNLNLNGGTIQWASAFALDSSRTIHIGASGGTLDTQGNNINLGNSPTITDDGSGGTVVKIGTGRYQNYQLADYTHLKVVGTGNTTSLNSWWSSNTPASLVLDSGSFIANAVTLDGGEIFPGGNNAAVTTVSSNIGITVTTNGGGLVSGLHRFLTVFEGTVTGGSTTTLDAVNGSVELADASGYTGKFRVGNDSGEDTFFIDTPMVNTNGFLFGSNAATNGGKVIQLDADSASYSTAITINNGGTLAVGNGTTAALGTAAITLDSATGATLAGGNATISNSINATGSGQFSIAGIAENAIVNPAGGGDGSAGGGIVTISGAITSASARFAKNNPADPVGTSGAAPHLGTQGQSWTVVELTNPANNWPIGTLAAPGTTVSGGMLLLGANGVLPFGSNMMIGAGSGKQFAMGGFSQTLDTLQGSGFITLDGTLTVGQGSSSDFTNANTLFNNVNHPERTGVLIKTGTKTMTLSGANSNWSGQVQINQGTIAISNNGNLGSDAPTNSVTFNGGTLQSSGSFVTARNYIVNSGGGTIDVTTSNNMTISSNVTGTGSLTKSDAGTLVLSGGANVLGGTLGQIGGTISITGNTAVRNVIQTAGTLAVNGSGYLHIPASARAASSTSVLASAPVIGGTGQIDLEDNAMIVNYGPADNNATRDTIRNLLINGRNAGPAAPAPWNGAGGITSTFAHNNGNGFNLAIGYADNAVLASINAAGSYTSFGGQTVASSTILVQMTYGADANLDGKVDGSDVSIIGTHFNQPGSGQWYFGDFDYSGMCDGNDISVLGTTFGQTSPALSPAQLTAEFGSAFASAFEAGQTGGAAVPEPASLTLIGLGGLALMSRRRRKASR